MSDSSPSTVVMSTEKISRFEIERRKREACEILPASSTDPTIYTEALEKYRTDPEYKETLRKAWRVIQNPQNDPAVDDCIDFGSCKDACSYANPQPCTPECLAGSDCYNCNPVFPEGHDCTDDDVTEYLKEEAFACTEWLMRRESLMQLPQSTRDRLCMTFPAFSAYDCNYVTWNCIHCPGRIRVSPRPIGGNPSGLQVMHMRSTEKVHCVNGNAAARGLLGTPIKGAVSLGLDAAATRKEPDWLIENVFARGDYWSLFGPSGVGKSLLALDWSLQMARNGVRVLYLDKENPEDMVRDRLRAMGANQMDMLRLAVVTFAEVRDLATSEGAKDIHEFAEQHRAEVIVLDTISKFSQTGQATHSDRWQRIYNESLVPLLKRGVSIGQIDHTGLSDQKRERDSSAKRDNVSLAYALTWRANGHLLLSRMKNRPGYGGQDSTTIQRVTNPVLTHRFGSAESDEVARVLEAMDKIGLPLSAGRPAATEALKAAGVPIPATALMAEAIRIRKDA